MTNLDDINAIRDRFEETWDDSIPVFYENASPKDKPKSIWVRFSIVPGDEEHDLLGPSKWKASGRVFLQIMVPASRSLNEPRAIEANFVAAFRDWHTSDYRIRFEAPSFAIDDSEPDLFILKVSIKYTARH